jgi:hypothetical protein
MQRWLVGTDVSKETIGLIFDGLLGLLDPSKCIDRQFQNFGKIPEKQKPQKPVS